MPKTLLLADDSVVIQKLVGLSFANEDIRLITLDNGDAAVARAREDRPDIVLADVVMPGKNGYEVCEAIKQDPALRNVPVLLLTGTFETFDEERARRAGSDGHVTKPFEAQALVRRVKELLEASAAEAAEQGDLSMPETSIGASEDAYEFFDEPADELAAPVEPAGPAFAEARTQPEPSPAPPVDPQAGAAASAPEDDFAFDLGSDETPELEPVPLLEEEEARSGSLRESGGATQPQAASDVGGDRTVALVPEAAPAGPSQSQAAGAATTVVADALLETDASDGEELGAELVDEDSFGNRQTDPMMSEDALAQSGEPAEAGAPPEATLLADDLFAEQIPAPSEPRRDAEADSFEFGIDDPGAEEHAAMPAEAPPPSASEPAGPSGFEGSQFDVSSSDLGEPLEAASDFGARPDEEPRHEPLGLEDSQPDAPGTGEAPLEMEEPFGARPESEPAEGLAFSAAELEPSPTDEVEPSPSEEIEPPSGDQQLGAATALPPAVQDRIHESLEKIAWEAFADLSDTIVREVMKRVEAIAWEVIPQMAETLIREEIRRIKGDGEPE